ncbi:helix-turn-helix transcriptional regulator [Acidaminobacter sp. JC074]|uniref:helix-turn-helix domain-containing protein n=1 Tax=Acidaminobacter sp. JC074 TaxID=2530199 RepID=UPI001F1179FF|nr:helix-turn-helix transcriptional regulator [Acidaminobacter sp. JC074]MCH4886090.1 helix-turn-helix transcriptional regulator [Acidaminobacter sp. JC074]
MENKKGISLNYISIEEKTLFLETDLIFIKVLEGSVIIRKDAEPMCMQVGDIVAIHAGTAFLLEKTEGHNLVTFLRLDRYLIRPFDRHIGPRLYVANSQKYESEFPVLYKKLRLILESITRIGVFENERNLYIHLKQLFNLLNNHFNYVTCGRQHEMFTPKMIARYRNIYKCYFKSTNQRSLKEISEDLSLNYDYLRKDIQQRYGRTYNYMKDYVRVSKSVKYLTETDVCITKISTLVGFSDHKYMVDRFKKWFGMTPSELRKTFTEKTQAQLSCHSIV